MDIVDAQVPHLAQYVQRFPDVQFVIDHCGAAFDAPPGHASIDDAVAMASYANVAYKWAHAPSFLSTEPYPFPDLEPKLRRAIDAFGPVRVMWASDYTMTRHRARGPRHFSASAIRRRCRRTKRLGFWAGRPVGF